MAKRKSLEQPRIKFDDIHGYLQELFKGDIHSKRVLSLANATQGVMASASLLVHAIGVLRCYPSDRDSGIPSACSVTTENDQSALGRW